MLMFDSKMMKSRVDLLFNVYTVIFIFIKLYLINETEKYNAKKNKPLSSVNWL